jgi:hypothetical protein
MNQVVGFHTADLHNKPLFHGCCTLGVTISDCCCAVAGLASLPLLLSCLYVAALLMLTTAGYTCHICSRLEV